MNAPFALPAPGSHWPLGTWYVCVPDLAEVRRLFGTQDMEARQRKSVVHYQGLKARQRLPQGMHDRCEEFVYAAGGFPSQMDQNGLAHHLPLHFKVVRMESHCVAKGTVWDLSVQRDVHWPELDPLEECYVFLHIDHLILEDGAQVIVRGDVFSMECGILERANPKSSQESVSADCFDFGILPTPASVDRNASANTGERGEDGISGGHGTDGTSVDFQGSLFGAYLPADQADVVTDGTAGAHGRDGKAGMRGRNGGMCRLADIRIDRLVGFEHAPLRIFSRAGNGAAGGDGGQGGNGGNGGHAGRGIEAINGRISSGRGGSGGDGGDGGDGGNGGNGGISSNIFVQLRPEDSRQVQTLSLSSVGGEAGRGGRGGRAGRGGSSPAGEDVRRDGPDGQQGIDGKAGKPGKGRPGANIFIISATETG